MEWGNAMRLSSPIRLLLLAAALMAALHRGAAAATFPAPILVAPANGATTTAATHPPLGIPEFAWQPVPGATTYRIQFSQDIAFTTKVEVVTANLAHTPTDASKFGDGTWYWRVRVESPTAGDWSEIWAFTRQWASADNAPQLLAPADAAAVDFYDPPIFSWSAVTGAASYRFQIATSSDGFAAATYNATTLATTHQPPAKLANGLYYWRVVPLDGAGREGAASAVRSFTAAYLAPPQLLAPANFATPTFTPTFRWAAARGAQFYRLQYGTDSSFTAVGVTTVDTRNTTFTPTSDLPNDVNVYWRVRVHSDKSVSEWSETRVFVKRWYLQPELLTPTNNYLYVRRPPLFSWTPAPGAAYYKIEVNDANSFPPGWEGWTATTANPFWTYPGFDRLPNRRTWYWRVTPYDRSGNAGLSSNVFSFEYDAAATAPDLIAPLPYYAPSPLVSPAEDRTAAWPIFIWQRTDAPAYRLQVSRDPLFDTVDWQVDTQNPAAAPTSAQPFEPQPNVDYFWRVRPLDGLGSSEMGQADPERRQSAAIQSSERRWSAAIQEGLDGAETGQWSQVWRARFDPGRALPATTGPAVTLLRPAPASETVEVGPLLEWQPVSAADSYDVQIGVSADFAPADIVRAESVRQPAYIPTVRLGFGTYYWRVLARRADGLPLGGWSEVWRFQVAAPSRWRDTRSLAAVENRNLIGFDLLGDMQDPNYDVTTLYAMQDKDDWFFGFDAMAGAEDMVYGLYLDLDHADGSGADTDARGYAITTIPAHRPEYAIYVRQVGGVITATQTLIYRWTAAGWAPPQRLSDLGEGRLSYDAAAGYVELRVPNTAIGMQETTGSAALMLFTARSAGGHAQDTVPADPAVAFVWPDAGATPTVLSRFTSVSGRMLAVWPPSAVGGDPTVFPTVLPFAFYPPTDTPWYGYNLQAARDARFTTVVLDTVQRPNLAGFAPGFYTHNKDLDGDNTYYWRVRPVYDTSGNERGPWSEAAAFERSGFLPQNLRTSLAFATPSFEWDRVEGAEAYELQVDEDPNFGSPAFAPTTSAISYTWTSTLAQGTYFWRVRGRRNGSIANGWTDAISFTLSLAEPAGLTTLPASPAARAPTLCWTPVVTPTAEPLFAAWKYRVQVSRDPNFSTEYDKADTEQACWTPTKGYPDGTYYWRAATIDGDGRAGSYSPPASFLKQYPVTTLLAPASGAPATSTPTFVWTPVPGAASYRLEVALSETFANLYDSITTANTRFTPTKKYDTDKTYYWRVAMIDKDGNRGPFTGDRVILRPGIVYLPLVLGP